MSVRFSSQVIDLLLVVTFLLLWLGTACLYSLDKVEPRSLMTCSSSIFWTKGENDKLYFRNCRVAVYLELAKN